jgi:hypothetical protein
MKWACTAQVLFPPAQAALAASTSQSFAGPDADHPRGGLGRGLLAWAIEVFVAAARARAAAHYYEELNRLSDSELAVRGLRRTDVPRAALHFLAADR